MACALWAAGVGVHAQSGANVAVVINDASPASVEIGEYYARKRAVPGSNVIHINAPVQETLARADYETSVEAPIAKALIERALQDRVLYIVLTKGVPLSITGRTGLRGDAASVDSELTLLYRKMTGRDVLVSGTIDNPYYADTRPIREAKPFSHRDQDIYLVTRLDGFTVEDVLALVDRGTAPSPDGRVMLDRRAGPTGIAELWLVEAATRLREQGQDRVDLTETAPADAFSRALIGYFSWGSNDPANRRRRLGLRFGPGAVAATLAGPDARTFAAPPETWQPGGHSGDSGNIFAQSTQSLIADLIRDGVTGVAGNVADPLLASAIRPQVLFPSYLSGFNLAESFYLALPHLSWHGVIVGDPLCRPFDGRVLTDADIEVPADPATGLPGHFAARRIAIAGERNRDAPREAIPLLVRSEDQLRAGNTTAARGTLERLVELAPDFAAPQLQLAVLDEASGDVEAAEQRYRRVLELQPGNPIALNNLAYRLAIGHKQPAEALPLARKAAAVAPQDARVLDTYGWIQHLLGNSAEAVQVLANAVRRAPDNAEIRLHAATALASIGSFDAAEGHLKEAVRLSPELDSRDDVQALRARLSKRR